MTKDQAYDYLTIGEVMQQTERDRDLAVIDFAQDRGHYVGVWCEAIVEHAISEREPHLPDYGEYDGDLDTDIRNIAREAVEWLNDEGLLPQGYGYDDERPGDGFGVIDTRGEGS